MTERLTRYCPACTGGTVPLMPWTYAGFDGSLLSHRADLLECTRCGLVRVDNLDDQVLNRYYTEQCLYSEASGIGVGASIPEDLARYAYYRRLLCENGLEDRAITDVGCSRGGFLLWLQAQGWRAPGLGIDVDLSSLPASPSQASGAPVAFRAGGALALPLADGSQTLLSYFHVLEHLVAVNRVLSEAGRVLGADGHLMIEVPDAERYRDAPVGRAFWMSLNEHVNHFSLSALEQLLARNGFELVNAHRALLPMPRSSYPSLIVLARKARSDARPLPVNTGAVAGFVREAAADLQAQARQVMAFAEGASGLTFWGCSYELFNLLPLLAPSLAGRRIRFCDANPVKQTHRIWGQPVSAPPDLPPEGVLLVCSYQSGAAIERAALAAGWPETAILRLV